jgi:putative transposase
MIYEDRKRPTRCPPVDLDNQSIIILVTASTKGRQRILCNERIVKLLREAWQDPSNWIVGRYVILPDHPHLFCSPNMFTRLSLRRWVASWKSYVTRRWKAFAEKQIWQRSFWDRQIRNGEGYDAKWDYVKTNPVRHGLVNDSGYWPHQGEIHRLFWHDRV